MRRSAALFLATLALATSVAAKKKPPKCKGVLKELVVDFETDASGKPLNAGDVPTYFPGGLKIVRSQRNDRANVKTTLKDHVIFDSANPVYDPDLFSKTEGNILIINKSNDPSKQDDERWGGLIRFKFTKPVFQVNSVRLLDIESINPNRTPDTVSGRSKRRRFQFTSTEIPPGGNNKPTTVQLEDYFYPKRLDINLEGSGAVTAINFSVCDTGRNRTLTEETFLPTSNNNNNNIDDGNTNNNEPRKLEEDVDCDKANRPFFRVDEEAVDFKLEWSSTDASATTLVGSGEEEEFLINPSFVFIRSGEDNGNDSNLKWVRVARRHSMVHDIWEDSSYQNRSDIREELLTYNSDIVLSVVPFKGNLSAGFTDAEIFGWGLQEPSDDFSSDSLTLRSGLDGDLRDSLCEPKARYGPEEGMLVRKQSTGPEDPKLFVLSKKSGAAEEDAEETVGLTFSSYPPSYGLSEWDDKCVFRMYTSIMSLNNEHAMDGAMETTPKELKCGQSLSDEKNWIAFQYENALHYVYSIEPHVVMKVDDDEGNCHQAYNTSFPYLNSLSTQVSLRGSATAVRYDESSFIALIHTYDGHIIEPYQTLVYKFEAQPPFRVLAVSRPLELQSAGLAFASSIVTFEDKVMVGYGVHDRSSRLMVMSRRYLDRQFATDECDKAMQTKVEATGSSCGQEALSLMIGSEMMTPRRAMNQIAETMSECRLLSGSKCSPTTILNKVRLSQQNVTSCAMAMYKVAGGEPCNARVKWLVTEDKVEERRAMRVVAEQYEDCQPLLDLNCGPEDLHWPNGKLTVCDAYIHNDYKKGGPGVLLSIGRAGSGLLRPLLQCVGISTETHKCQGKKELSFIADEARVKQCLDHGQYHFVKLHPYIGGDPAQKGIEKVSRLAANLGNRTAGDERPKIVTMVRDPLRVVFAWLEAEFGGLTAPSKSLIRNYQTRIDRYEFTQLASTMEGHRFIMESIRRNCYANIKDWDVIKSVILDPHYDTLMVTGEELRSRVIRPALLASLSNHILGKPSSRETIFKGIQTIDSVYSSKVDAKGSNLICFTDFYLHTSPEGMPYICHLIQEVPEMVRAIAEQNYKAGFAKLAAYCPGFDEGWLDDMAEPIFIGLTERK